MKPVFFSKMICFSSLFLLLWTSAYMTFFTVKMLKELGVLFTALFLTKTVDNVTPLLVNAKER